MLSELIVYFKLITGQAAQISILRVPSDDCRALGMGLAQTIVDIGLGWPSMIQCLAMT